MKDEGFSLLEVVVALAIMAGGFLAVLQLYSMSVRSLGTSEKYFKATILAQSKMAELELNNFDIDKDVGEFKYDEGYRWKVEISPYDSPLNSEEESIQLSLVRLTVFWNEGDKLHSANLSTIKLDGSSYPIVDRRLEQNFTGGSAARSLDDLDFDRDSDSPDLSPNSSVPPICGNKQRTSNSGGTLIGTGLKK